MSLEVQQLVKTYGTQHAVNDISFTVAPGEIVGFLGPNGAGKSTTMKIASGYLPPTSGTVKVQGLDVTQHSKAVRQRIGYLPEHNPLYLEMYVHEYLLFMGRLQGLRGKALRNRVGEMVELTGLQREQHKPLGALSKGYRQRVGLAQSLVHDPPVLILDEPTTGLDPNQIVEVRKVIKDLSREKTVVLSTHIMQEVQALCNRVVIINRGQIVANNTLEELHAQASGGEVLLLHLEGAVDLAKLQQLAGVERVTTEDNGRYRLELGDQALAEVRKAAVNLAAHEGWDVLSLSREETSLEHIFQSLTQTTN